MPSKQISLAFLSTLAQQSILAIKKEWRG